MEFSQLLGIGIAYILSYCYSDSKRTSCQSNMDKQTFTLSIPLIHLFFFCAPVSRNQLCNFSPLPAAFDRILQARDFSHGKPYSSCSFFFNHLHSCFRLVMLVGYNLLFHLEVLEA
jgi:hypothetical protein